MQAWRPHVWTWALSEADLLYWRKFLWYCWDFSVTPGMVQCSGNCASPAPLVTSCSNCTKYCAIFRPLCSRPNAPDYDVTSAHWFLRGKQMAACEQIRVVYMLWWLTILVTWVSAEFHVLRFFIALKYCLWTVVWVLRNIIISYRQWKTKPSIPVQKSIIDQDLHKIKSNLASSLAQLIIQNRKWYWSYCQNTQEKIAKLSLLSVAADLLHHNHCLFLRTWCWKGT